MKSRQVFSLTMLAILTGCTAERLPELVAVSEPPSKWGVIRKKDATCPDLSGSYELVPLVADLQSDGSWQFSKGQWYDFILLVPSNQAPDKESDSIQNLVGNSDHHLQIESTANGKVLRITNPDKNGEELSSYIFSTSANDFKCKDGSLIFPEFQISGGTEGAYLNGRVYIQANITTDGNLLFYEQVKSYKVVQKYYIFRKIVMQK